MGIYLNPNGEAFEMAVQSDIYVDKTNMLSYLNSVMGKEQRFVCVSRPRRFGKSMAANMVSAYYSKRSDAEKIFKGLAIAQSESFQHYAGKYDVIHLNIQDFLSNTTSMDEMLSLLQRSILWDILKEYPDFDYFERTSLMRTMSDVYQNTNRRFVIVIDEWDCVFREYKEQTDEQRQYLDFLRTWMKDKSYVGLAYMTGILPIKKYGTHSALNMFNEFSMTDAGPLAEFVGFTEQEVRGLCDAYQMDFEECKAWYDGYRFNEVGSIYNPRSVVQSMLFHKYNTYWNQTETFEALKVYIDMNFDGMREAVISLMSGDSRKISTANFANDMTTFRDMEDVLTLLVHLGYLGYDFDTSSVFIPNQEILAEYANSVRSENWNSVAAAVKASEELLECTLNMEAEKVAHGIEVAHLETSHLTYNDENALAYTVSLAYYTARRKYLVVREFPTGKGFADLVYLPRPTHPELPAMIIELKWNQSTKAAIDQIKERQYVHALTGYKGRILLVGIRYDKSTKNHSCKIEEWEQ